MLLLRYVRSPPHSLLIVAQTMIGLKQYQLQNGHLVYMYMYLFIYLQGVYWEVRSFFKGIFRKFQGTLALLILM